MRWGIESYDDPACPWHNSDDGFLSFTEAHLITAAFLLHRETAPKRGRYLAEVAPFGFVLVEDCRPVGHLAQARNSQLMSPGATEETITFGSMSRATFAKFRELGRIWVSTGRLSAMVDAAEAEDPNTPMYANGRTIEAVAAERAQVAPPQN